MLKGSASDPWIAHLSTAKQLSTQGRCPSCRCQIHVLESDVHAVIKTAVIKVSRTDNRVYGKCPRCKSWLIVPLRYAPAN